MAILNNRRKFTLIVLLNIFIINQCQNEYDFEDIKNLMQDRNRGEENEDYQKEPTFVPQHDQHVNYGDAHNTSKETTDNNFDTTVTVEYANSNEGGGDAAVDASEVDRDDRVGTTVQHYMTEASTSYIDNNVYNKDNAVEDIYMQNGVNIKQSEYTTTQDSTRSGDSAEATSNPELDEEQDTIRQRNPKTEVDSKEQSEKRALEKARPTPALSKSWTLKSWLEDSWLRPPAGILVPLRPLALSRALAVWNDLTDDGLNMTDIVIVGYDFNGINWRSRHNLQPSSSGTGERAVSEALSKLLLKYQDVYTDSSSDGTMRALASAAKLVPYDSALFLITDKGAGDPQRLPLALRALIEKRLKVYTIWTDPGHPSLDSELALQDLKNVSMHTDGEVLPYAIQIMEEDNSDNLASEAELQQWVPLDLAQPRHARLQTHPELENFDTLLIRRGAGEAISLGVPIEAGISALRIHMEGALEHAVIYPPNDEPQIDLNNITSVHNFSPASSVVTEHPRDVYLVFPGTSAEDNLSVLPVTPSGADASEYAGVWHLSVRCDTCDYRIRVSARSHIHFDVELQKKDTLRLRVTGPVASVRESVLVDEFGMELSKLSFSYQPDRVQDTVGLLADMSVDVPLPQVASSKVYVKILGRDVTGAPFVRLGGPLNTQTEVRLGRSAAVSFPDDLERVEQENFYMFGRLQHNDTSVLPFTRSSSQVLSQGGSILTSVQIGLSTKLYGAPGDRLQLHFEVTNAREESVRFNFGAVGELRFLTGIEPASLSVAAGQTANVIVSLLITASAQPGARDLITFTAYGIERVSMSAYVYVMNPGESLRDVWAPDIRHNFGGSCMGRQGDDCSEHVWSAAIIAQDKLGGLLRLISLPPGLLYEGNFISGTREEVMATYRATCCSPRVVVNAVDAFGNTNSYVIDISSYISGAGIAAIVLGVILLIIIIALLIMSIYWCVKRRRQSKELPTFGTSRNLN